MTMRITLENVRRARKKETDLAIEENGHYFNSLHEGYAVMLEELDEANSEVGNLINQVELIWYDIKTNDLTIERLEEGIELADKAAAELIQTGAMLKRLKITAEYLEQNHQEGEY